MIQIEPVQTRDPVPDHQATVDIIVCVHNSLHDVQRCFESVLRHTTPPYSLILVDDGSAPETRDYLFEFSRAQNALLLRNEEAKGYTVAANQGLCHFSADYAVLLNSDTVVTPKWLDRLIACADSNPKIGLVGPLSNTASWQSIPEVEQQGDWAANPLPAGMTKEEMGQLVARYSARLYPKMPFLNGFCLLIRQQVIQEIGYFDEKTFGAGYGEENDYALRARKANWRLALADDAYVYHAQSRSYSEKRKHLSERAGVVLVEKHGQQAIRTGVSFCRHDRVLEGMRARSRAMIARQEWIRKGRESFSCRRVLFLLPIAAPGGGGNVVIDEARAMREMEVQAEIFNLVTYHDSFQQAYPDIDVPTIYGKQSDLIHMTEGYDALVATTNTSLEWLTPITNQESSPVIGYYVQDFEPYMYPPNSEDFQRAWDSYTLFPNLVRLAKTEWTRQEIKERIGVDAVTVGCSVNIDLFRPRPRARPEWPERPISIVAMIRPHSPYRAPALTMQILKQASKKYRGGVEITIFGTHLDHPDFATLPQDFPWQLTGVINQKQVARLLNESDIFVDFSSHQAMGLTAMEAMACGAAVIVPKRGGATSFACHEENSLVIDTSSPEACWRALQRLVEDHSLRKRIQRNALSTMSGFFPERPAFNTLHALFDRERTTSLGKNQGTDHQHKE